jgi:hypothetical protein
MTKIDRYQGGWINRNNGAINDHQENECVVKFNHIPKDKKDKLLNACLNILNEEKEQDDNFCFEYTKDFERIDSNTLMVDDTHTKIDCDGKKIRIILNPPNTEPYTFEYHIMGVIFNKTI